MTPSAITMMIVAIVVVGGGLLVSVIVLITHPEQPEITSVANGRTRSVCGHCRCVRKGTRSCGSRDWRAPAPCVGQANC